MNQSPKKFEPPPPGDPQGISKWARVYAQNRSLGVVVSMIVFLVLFAVIGGMPYLGGVAYRSGNMLLFCVSIALLVPAMAGLLYLSVPRWSGRLMERVVKRLYAREGNVGFSAPCARKKVWGRVLAGFLGISIVASIAMRSVFDIPVKYMQPISALYAVPFLVGLWFLMRPTAGYLALLWPTLYAIHAILILAGAPIVFTGPWDALNMLIPVAGYGLLSGLVQHLYSRVALGRLRRLARIDPTGADRPEEVGGR